MISKYVFIQSKQISIKKEILSLYNVFHPIKICLYYMNFSFDTFLVDHICSSILFAKVRIFLLEYKLKSTTMF